MSKHFVKAAADNESCLLVFAKIHKILFDLLWIFFVNRCNPAMCATLEAKHLEVCLPWLEAETGNCDILSVVEIIKSDSAKFRDIQSSNLSWISSLCSVKYWQR